MSSRYDPKRPTRGRVAELTKQGHTPQEIARFLDVTTQAVYYHLSKLRRAGELPEKKAS